METVGHSACIALMWRNKDEANLCSFNKNHINLILSDKDGNKYRLTEIYGEPNRSKKKETWELICRLATHNSPP